VQQQFLDVAIVRRGRGRFAGRLPDGLEGLAEHNLTTFRRRRQRSASVNPASRMMPRCVPGFKS
jgi:hypothetical protein